ncbi:MAG: hypothetical protein U0996_04985 [Planctomycetaceae bacterium]
MPRKRWFKLALASLFALSASHCLAQDSVYAPCEPDSFFTGSVEYLLFTRDADITNPGPVIGGPNTGLLTFGDTNFDYQSGFRVMLGYSSNGARVEGVFANFGTWNYNSVGSLTSGLSFDEGINAGNPWAGSNFINLTTGFQGLHGAASGGLGGDADEFEGLGPNVPFPADAFPTYEVYYKSTLHSFELNLWTEDPDSFVQFGAGYRYLSLDEVAGTEINGVFRAADVAAPNNGLSHASLIGAGGLTFLGGTANGFEDENGNASGLPDNLQMIQEARTTNDLNGVQLMAQPEIMYWRGWVVNGVIKAGIYHNSVSGSVTERYVGTDPGVGGDTSIYGRTFSDSKDSLAFAGALGIQSDFPLSENWSLIGGYEMLLIHGVALGPEQFAALKGALPGQVYDVDTHGQIIAHGANVGLQFTY